MAMIISFSHIYLPVRNVDESIGFYTKNLGFRLLRKYRTTEGGNPSAYVELGEVLLELTQARQPLPADEGRVEARIGLTVTDVDAVRGRQAMVKDPSGYGISLREWQAPDSPHFDEWQPKHEGVSRIA